MTKGAKIILLIMSTEIIMQMLLHKQLFIKDIINVKEA